MLFSSYPCSIPPFKKNSIGLVFILFFAMITPCTEKHANR